MEKFYYERRLIENEIFIAELNRMGQLGWRLFWVLPNRGWLREDQTPASGWECLFERREEIPKKRGPKPKEKVIEEPVGLDA